MVAPSIIGAEAPFNGESWLGLVEECLRERGLTNGSYGSTDSTYTAASAQQLAQAKKCVNRALCYLQACRSRWFPMSEEDAAAASPFTRVALPTDFLAFGDGGAWINGVRLHILTPEEYAANIRSTTDGGGIKCAEVSGPPSHARLVISPITDTLVYYRWSLEVYPVQTTTWTAHVLYVASAKNITTDIIVRVPVAMQSILMDLVRAEWRKLTGDTKGAAEFKALADAGLDDVRELPGNETVLRAKSGVPVENASRGY